MEEEIKIPETTGLRVKESTKADLLTAAKWTKFLCIVGSIGIALIVIFAIFLFGAGTVASSMFSDMPFGAAEIPGNQIILPYTLYILQNIFCVKYKLQRGIYTQNT